MDIFVYVLPLTLKNETIYESLNKKYKNQSARKFFAHFPFNQNEGQTWKTPFSYFANMTKNQDEWNFKKLKRLEINIQINLGY